MPTLVNSGQANSVTASFTGGGTATTNNLLIAVCFSTGGVTTPSGWTSFGFAQNLGQSRCVDCAYKIAAGGETGASFTGSGARSTMVLEYSGMATSGVLLANQADTYSGSGTPVTDTVTPTSGVPALTVFGFTSGSSAPTWSSENVNGSTTGVTERFDTSGAVFVDLAMSSTSGSYYGQATDSTGSSSGVSFIGIFKAAPPSILLNTGVTTTSSTQNLISKIYQPVVVMAASIFHTQSMNLLSLEAVSTVTSLAGKGFNRLFKNF